MHTLIALKCKMCVIYIPGAQPAADPVSRYCLVAFCVLLVVVLFGVCCFYLN